MGATSMNSYDEGMDECFTPLESRRRSEMKIRNVRFGFFRVATEPIEQIYCTCSKNITNISHIKVNGVHICNSCYANS